MPLNFADVAAKPLAEIERPPLPPVGTYRWRITKRPEPSTTADGNWDILRVMCQVVEALDDVEVEDYPGDLTKVVNNVTFMFDKNDEAAFEKTLYNAKRFFQDHVKCAGADDTIAQAIEQAMNGEFLGTVAWRADKNDAELFHANIARTAPVE